MKSNSSNSIDDTPDDEYLEKGDEKSAELESVRQTKVRGGKHEAVNGQGSGACEKTHLSENTLDPHMHLASCRT